MFGLQIQAGYAFLLLYVVIPTGVTSFVQFSLKFLVSMYGFINYQLQCELAWVRVNRLLNICLFEVYKVNKTKMVDKGPAQKSKVSAVS